MPDYDKLALFSTVYLIEGNEDIVNNEEIGFLPTNGIFVNNQYMIMLKTAFENIGLFDKERRKKLIAIYNKIIGSYNYVYSINDLRIPIKDFTIEPNNIQMLVGEIIDVYVICTPKFTTDINTIGIYNPNSNICSVKQISATNNILHFTIEGKDDGTTDIEITGGNVLKKLNVIVNY